MLKQSRIARCFSSDCRDFQNKERTALPHCPVIVALSPAHPLSQLVAHAGSDAERCVLVDARGFVTQPADTSGVMAIEYALMLGFRFVWTAGIDLNAMPHPARQATVRRVATLLAAYPEARVYKACHSSALPAETRAPPLESSHCRSVWREDVASCLEAARKRSARLRTRLCARGLLGPFNKRLNPRNLQFLPPREWPLAVRALGRNALGRESK